MAYGRYNTEALTFPQIILTHVKRILEISTHELRVSERILVVDNVKSIVESEDLRKAYCQAVQNLGYALTPYFDEKAEEAAKKHIPIIEGFAYEVVELIKDEKFKERMEKADDTTKANLIIMIQLRHAQKLFVELNSLLLRVSYLAKGIFGDTADDDDVIEDEEDIE